MLNATRLSYWSPHETWICTFVYGHISQRIMCSSLQHHKRFTIKGRYNPALWERFHCLTHQHGHCKRQCFMLHRNGNVAVLCAGHDYVFNGWAYQHICTNVSKVFWYINIDITIYITLFNIKAMCVGACNLIVSPLSKIHTYIKITNVQFVSLFNHPTPSND